MTDFRPILQAWRELLPADVCVAAGPLLDATPLTLCECASVGVVNDDRMREFKNGRLNAKNALAMLGVYDVERPIAGPYGRRASLGVLRT